jgi:hypothetical protein
MVIAYVLSMMAGAALSDDMGSGADGIKPANPFYLGMEIMAWVCYMHWILVAQNNLRWRPDSNPLTQPQR